MSDAVLSSQAVFRSRATEIGVDPAAIQSAIDQSIGTLGQFGFSTSFIPGHFSLSFRVSFGLPCVP